jgi:hypothetical protein
MRASLLALVLTGAAGAVATLPASPTMAQVQDQVVTVYGDDPCPASNGQEIVVCRHLPRSEQFRIPKDLRESEAAPQAVSSTALAAVQTTGGTATQVQSCNSIGAGVSAGCFKKEADAWKAQQRAEKKAEGGIP